MTGDPIGFVVALGVGLVVPVFALACVTWVLDRVQRTLR